MRMRFLFNFMKNHKEEITTQPSYDWPVVLPNDDGIRPAGDKDKCFYCQQRVGRLHKKDCVIVTKKWRLKVTFTIEKDYPFIWDKHSVEFSLNESSSCSNNILNDIIAEASRNGCACSFCESTAEEIEGQIPHRQTQEEAKEEMNENANLIKSFYER